MILTIELLNRTSLRKLIAPSRRRKNPKSEYRNPKQTQKRINLKSGKSKTPNPNEACLEFSVFWSFEFVSNFGSFDMAQDRFRASNCLFLAPFRPFDVAQGMLCARYSFFRSSLDPKISNIFGERLYLLNAPAPTMFVGVMVLRHAWC